MTAIARLGGIGGLAPPTTGERDGPVSLVARIRDERDAVARISQVLAPDLLVQVLSGMDREDRAAIIGYNGAGELTSYCLPVTVAAGGCTSGAWRYGRDGLGTTSPPRTRRPAAASASSTRATTRSAAWRQASMASTPRPTATMPPTTLARSRPPAVAPRRSAPPTATMSGQPGRGAQHCREGSGGSRGEHRTGARARRNRAGTRGNHSHGQWSHHQDRHPDERRGGDSMEYRK